MKAELFWIYPRTPLSPFHMGVVTATVWMQQVLGAALQNSNTWLLGGTAVWQPTSSYPEQPTGSPKVYQLAESHETAKPVKQHCSTLVMQVLSFPLGML